MSSSHLRSFRLLYLEGAFAIAFETWVGPTYLSGLAGELGVSVLCVSLITSAAWIGAVGQLLGAWAFERVPSYKRYTIGVASAARGLWVLPVFLAAFWTYRLRTYGEAFPTERWFMLTAFVAAGAALFGASSGSAWNSWVRALVPEEIRGRFFGTRHRYVMGALTAAHLIALVCLDWRPGGYRAGFALLGAMALICAATSTLLLSRVQEAGSPSVPEGEDNQGFFERIAEPLRDARFRGVVIFGAIFNGTIQLASPYFPYYFTKELHLPMSQIAAWLALTNLGCMVAAGRWGKHLDRTGDPRPVLKLTGSLLALSPLFYVFGSVGWVLTIAPIDYFSNGMIWIGFQLAMTTLLFKSIPLKRTALCFSIYSASSGLAGAVCSMLGGRIAEMLPALGGFRALWVIASCARLIAVWGLYRLLQSGTRVAPAKGRVDESRVEPRIAVAGGRDHVVRCPDVVRVGVKELHAGISPSASDGSVALAGDDNLARALEGAARVEDGRSVEPDFVTEDSALV